MTLFDAMLLGSQAGIVVFSIFTIRRQNTFESMLVRAYERIHALEDKLKGPQ